jgi:CHAD domain-containing protein
MQQLAEERSISLGDFAHDVIAEQYQRIIDQENGVLSDTDSEYLHQMRVGTRRLRTALQVFENVVDLPETCSFQRVKFLGKALGKLRDLDVQIYTLTYDYHPHLESTEQLSLDDVLISLKKQRRKAFTGVKTVFKGKKYQSFKVAYEEWLNHPQYRAIAQLPLAPLLPDLLSPLLSHFLLHPGWLVDLDNLDEADTTQLHDLRKSCKHVRYQAEFFAPVMGQEFTTWIKELKKIQDDLGMVQDSYVLQDLLEAELPNAVHLTEVEAIAQRDRQTALTRWDITRQNYLDPAYRHQLHRMLIPAPVADSPHPADP